MIGCSGDDFTKPSEQPEAIPKEEIYENNHIVNGENDIKVEIINAIGSKGGNNTSLSKEEIKKLMTMI